MQLQDNLHSTLQDSAVHFSSPIWQGIHHYKNHRPEHSKVNRFGSKVELWVKERLVGRKKLIMITNYDHENFKYLPGDETRPNGVATVLD